MDRNQKQHLLIKENNNQVKFPDNCAFYMKLATSDKQATLKAMGMCPTCATDHRSKQNNSTVRTPCNATWENRKYFARCKGKVHLARINKEVQCHSHWTTCQKHYDENETHRQKF